MAAPLLNTLLRACFSVLVLMKKYSTTTIEFEYSYSYSCSSTFVCTRTCARTHENVLHYKSGGKGYLSLFLLVHLKGCDKQFFNASIQFENMDKLVKYINMNSKALGVKVKYATLGEYFEAIYNTNSTWALKQEGDFLSYSSGKKFPMQQVPM